MRLILGFAGLVIIAGSMMFSFSVHANSAEINVKGTIIPTSCVPKLADGGVVDYGDIGSGQLDRDNFTLLAEKKVSFSIICQAPARIALRTIDNRSSSVIPGAAQTISRRMDEESFGLGTTVSGKNVGVFTVDVDKNSFETESGRMITIFSIDEGKLWGESDRGEFRPKKNFITSWSSSRSGPPTAFVKLSGTFKVNVALNALKDLALVNTVPLDGLATIELIYL